MSVGKEKTILLGACPYCGGGVTASVGRIEKSTLTSTLVFFQYASRPECANGCPIDRFDDTRTFFNAWTLDKDYDPAPLFRSGWALHVRWFKERSKCPRCGGVAHIRTGKEPAMGCPRCDLWAEDTSYGGVTVSGLVDEWERLVEDETLLEGFGED